MVDIKLVRETSRFIALRELKEHKDGMLRGMQLLAKGMPDTIIHIVQLREIRHLGSRLSVQRVERSHWDFIVDRLDEAIQ